MTGYGERFGRLKRGGRFGWLKRGGRFGWLSAVEPGGGSAVESVAARKATGEAS